MASFLAGGATKSGSSLEGEGESLQAKLGRKLDVAFLATTNINNNKKRSPLSTLRLLESPALRVGDGSTGPLRPRAPSPTAGHGSGQPYALFFLPFLFSFLLPLSIYSFFLFFFPASFFFFLNFFFVLFFVFLSPLLPLGPPSPRPAPPSVGEDQVRDAGLQPISRDHLAHLGRAIVWELEVGA